MNVVIADASCLILFTNLGRLDILKILYGEIWVTIEVSSEYGIVLPDFISIHNPVHPNKQASFFSALDAGEAASIALALENPGCQIIIDEKKGRRIALELGLDVKGTLGVLKDAASQGLVSADESLISELDRQGFRLSPDLRAELLSRS